MKINCIECKTALSSSTLPGLTYSLNPYRGCSHNCAYCYAPNVLRIPRQHWGDVIEVKTNIPLILAKELKHKKHGVVGLSTVTDPYQSLEQHYHLTNYCLEQLLKYDMPVHIQTKSSLILQDIDIITKFSNIQVMVSIGTLNDEERILLEPGSSSIQERLNILKTFTDAGVKTSVFFGPIYPTLTVENIPAIIDTFHDYGASEIMIDAFRFKPGIWENMLTHLSEKPAIKQLFIDNLYNNQQYYQEIRKEINRIRTIKNIIISDAF